MTGAGRPSAGDAGRRDERLSLCMLASGPPAQVRAVLECWRPWVGEVVVAVDDRHAELAGAIGDLVDRLHVVPAPENGIVEDVLVWLHHQCTREWIVRVDDDELPADGLFDELREIVDRDAVTHVYCRHLSLYPDAAHAVVSEPWRETQALRILRNLPAVWQAPDGLHTSMGAVGAHAIMDRGLLHLLLLVTTLPERRAKVRRYEAAGAVPTHESGRSVNAFYLPEEQPDLELEPLPAADAARVRAVLRAIRERTPERPAGPVAAVRPVTRAEIDRYAGPRAGAGDGPYRARLRAVRPPASMVAGTTRHVLVEVTNLGDAWWPWEPDAARPGVRLGQRWSRAGGEEVPWEAVRSQLPEPVAPGQAIRALVALQAPPEPGALTVTVDLVHELVRWFGAPLRLPIAVTPAPPGG